MHPTSPSWCILYNNSLASGETGTITQGLSIVHVLGSGWERLGKAQKHLSTTFEMEFYSGVLQLVDQGSIPN